jgi:pimeloyl-ACP methyl ester carboxylesterase
MRIDRREFHRDQFKNVWQVTVIWIALCLSGCSPDFRTLPDYHGDPHTRGSIVRVEHLFGLPAFALRLIIWYMGSPKPIPVTSGIDLYRIAYWSESGGRPVLVSGLLTMPAAGPLRGTVIWMHGTQMERGSSQSSPAWGESVPVSGVFAGGGYALVAPDLVGLGASKDIQAYFCNASTVSVTRDFLRAAQRVTADLGRTWNSDLYLVGFSQGGHSVAVLQRAFEADPNSPWHVKASAGIAGPYDIGGITIPFALKGESTGDSQYLSMFTLSYASFYHLSLGSALKPKYAAIVPRLFDGNHTREDVDKDLPADPRLLFNSGFLSALEARGDNWLLRMADRNEAFRWRPRAPFRAYYGENDVDVPPAEAKHFVKVATSMGGHVLAVDVGPYDHDASVVQAVPRVRDWFDEISASHS